MRNELNEPYRQLNVSDRLAALIAIGVDAEEAAEWNDDPNAMPRRLKDQLNAHVSKNQSKVKK